MRVIDVSIFNGPKCILIYLFFDGGGDDTLHFLAQRTSDHVLPCFNLITLGKQSALVRTFFKPKSQLKVLLLVALLNQLAAVAL